MSGYFKVILAALLLLSSSVCLAEESPERFLSQILEEDFQGDGGSRAGKAYYSDGKGDEVGDCGCVMSRAVYDVKGDPLLVVTKWEIVRVDAKRKKTAVIDVRFRVCGRTEGERWAGYKNGVHIDTLRSIVPFEAIADETVTYRLVKKMSGWLLVDPPLPGVAQEAVAKEMQRQLVRFEEVIAEDKGRDDVRRKLENLKGQLAALRKANCQGE
ncbi:MAG: hypothetical protein WC722_13495 [Rhodospirillales bacterium]|jgi:hypothetical protein